MNSFLYFKDNVGFFHGKNSKFFMKKHVIKSGNPFISNQCLFHFIERFSQGGFVNEEEREFLTPKGGFVVAWKQAEDQPLNLDQPIVEIFECSHDVLVKGLCAMCGKFVSDLKMDKIVFAHHHIQVSKNEAERIDGEKEKLLLSSRKLALVLDLDHTLIHATTQAMLPENALPEVNNEDLYEFCLDPVPLRYFVKLRPGLKNFLAHMSVFFELYIYTMGTRQYATFVAELLNPPDQPPFFPQHRIIARDDFSEMSKNLQRLFPCKDHMVVILDDREDVWITAQNQVSPNLIRVEPYHYFDTRAELNSLPTDTPWEGSQSPSLNDNALSVLEGLLIHLHRRFYLLVDQLHSKPLQIKQKDIPDTKLILQKFKKKVFCHCKIVFSGIIPTHISPPLSYEWKLAQAFGAKCSTEIDEETTHLVAKTPGTAKVNAALKIPGLFLVNYDWFLQSIRQWNRQDELLFPVADCPVLRSGSQPRVPPIRSEPDFSEEEEEEEEEENENFEENLENGKQEMKRFKVENECCLESSDEGGDELNSSTSEWALSLEHELFEQNQ